MAFTLGYRPALDGLRGVAILGVLAIHSGSPLASGGFLGVDLFFVLSGFLITSLLLAEWDATRGIRLGHFYLRRTLRLLPALVVLLSALALFSTTIPLRPAAEELQREIVFTLFYVANWALAFGAMPAIGMLGHAWSLAIEEQFYLLWPLMLLAMLRAGISRRTLALLTIAATALSAIHRFAMWQHGATPDRLFFGFDTRCDSLLAGCAAALLVSAPERTAAPGSGSALRVAAAASGVTFLVLVATASREDAFLYCGGFTMVAVAAALVLLEVVEHPSGLPARALSSRPLVHVGRISYALYLWHWPIFLFLAVAKYDFSPVPNVVVALAASFGAAEISYWLVERPFLRWKGRWRAAGSSQPPL